MYVQLYHCLVLVFRSEGDRISSAHHVGLQKNSVWGLLSLCLSAYKVVVFFFLIHQIMMVAVWKILVKRYFNLAQY